MTTKLLRPTAQTAPTPTTPTTTKTGLTKPAADASKPSGQITPTTGTPTPPIRRDPDREPILSPASTLPQTGSTKTCAGKSASNGPPPGTAWNQTQTIKGGPASPIPTSSSAASTAAPGPTSPATAATRQRSGPADASVSTAPTPHFPRTN